VTSVISYRATVNDCVTRATVNEEGSYVFEAGDRLFVTSGENLYGTLMIIGGVGQHSATFEGELNCVNGFTPSPTTPLSATLVSLNDKLHRVQDGKVTATAYPENEWASDLADAYSKYSDFTASCTYAEKSFTLQQNSSFLVFSVTLNDGVSAQTDVLAEVENNGTLRRSATLQSQAEQGSVMVKFATAFAQGTQLTNPKLSLTVAGTKTTLDLANQTLAANKYYRVTRSLFTLPDFFTIQATEAQTQITFQYATAANAVQYTTDGGNTWQSYLTTDGAITLANAGDRVGFRGQGTLYHNTSGNTPLFTVADNKPVYVFGNLMSLMSDADYHPGTATTVKYAFKSAFRNATWIRVAEGKKLTLPATTLASCSYESLFDGCTGLTVTPVDNLPSTDLNDGVYYRMFAGCTNMTSAPTISATAAPYDCCNRMFLNCTSLEVAPRLLPTDLAKQCYYEMFSGCSSLSSVPVLTVNRVDEASCYGMFRNCSSLTSVPGRLMATQLYGASYKDMFNSCSSLQTAPSIEGVTSVDWHSLRSMFAGCRSLEQVNGSLNVATLQSACYREMFANCTSLRTVPSFGTIATMAEEACMSMFLNCSSLEAVSIGSTASELKKLCCYSMFNGCSGISVFYSMGTVTTVAQECCRNMYVGCVGLTASPITLAASTLANNCYQEMFRGCSHLSSVTCLATDISASNCLTGWMNGVSESGTFTKASSMTTMPEGASGIPSGWTIIDEN